MKTGFTLIELLVVVLIIGILAAIALPQYQHAVLKSRFAGLMPIAKAIAGGQEAYFMTNGAYATQLEDLDVTTTANNNKSEVNLSDLNTFKYVKLTRDDLNNNLIIYQKHSQNYPDEIHCEAKEGDTQAIWLCETAFHATQNLGAGVTAGYQEYVLNGAGNGRAYVNTSKYDVNKDGVVDEKDITEIMKIYIGASSIDYDLESADVNGDGDVNNADAVQLSRLLDQ